MLQAALMLESQISSQTLRFSHQLLHHSILFKVKSLIATGLPQHQLLLKHQADLIASLSINNTQLKVSLPSNFTLREREKLLP
jgi:hypothetical protein